MLKAISDATSSEGVQPRIRRGIVNSIAVSSDPRAGQLLVSLLGQDDDPLVRMKAALAIGRRETHGGEAALIGALADTDHRVFVAAAGVLSQSCSPEVARQIVAAATARPSTAKQRVIQIWRKGPNESAARTLFIGFADDPDSSVRRSAIRALDDFDHRSAVKLALRELPRSRSVEAATYKNILASDARNDDGTSS